MKLNMMKNMFGIEDMSLLQSSKMIIINVAGTEFRPMFMQSLRDKLNGVVGLYHSVRENKITFWSAPKPTGGRASSGKYFTYVSPFRPALVFHEASFSLHLRQI
jgi:hypothetical protein